MILAGFFRFFFCALLLFVGGAAAAAVSGAEEDGGYKVALTELLGRPLWKEGSAYNAGHYLMLPLHAAYASGDADIKQAFSQHYERMLSRKSDIAGKDAISSLSRLQYLYTASRYLVVSRSDAVAGLEDFLLSEVRQYWESKPAWQWGREPFFGGFRERLEWKLNVSDVKRSYYRAIIDEELFLFGIAADIASRIKHRGDDSPLFLTEILDFAYRVFSQEGRFFEGGRWLFQVGVWADHPDYAYAGNLVVRAGLGETPVRDVAMDSSHAHRFPLILLGLQGAEDPGSERYIFYQDVREGLAKQFFDVVLSAPSSKFPFYRVTNFMDGGNGVFRYQYGKMKKGKGYGSYSLSGTVLLGWWVFLPCEGVYDVYENLKENYSFVLQWVADNDPYGEAAWMFQDGYLDVLRFLPAVSLEFLRGVGRR